MAALEPALTLSLHSLTTHNIKARSPSLCGLVSLAPSDFVIGAALSVAMVSFFWPSSVDHDEAVLMTGLSAALDGYPTLVGRLQAGGKVSCNNEGIPVVVGTSPLTLSDFTPPGPTTTFHIPIDLEEYIKQVPPQLTSQSPMLAITIARLACGGMAMMLTYHHVVADMHSARQLVYDWASAARAITAGGKAPELSAHPCGRLPYDKLVLGLPASMSPPEPLTDVVPIPSSPWIMVPHKDRHGFPEITGGRGSVMVFFSKQRLAELKALATSQIHEDGVFVSTNDVMAARMRQVLAKLPCRGPSRPTIFHFACEQRGRVKTSSGQPFVEEEFVGNCVSMRLTDPLDPTTADLGTLALSMRSAIQSTQEVACKEYAWLWELERRHGYEHLWTALPGKLDMFSPFPDFGVSNWEYKDAKRLDFGSGPAVWMQSGLCLPFSEGAILMPALHSDYEGGIFVHLYASKLVIADLLAMSEDM